MTEQSCYPVHKHTPPPSDWPSIQFGAGCQQSRFTCPHLVTQRSSSILCLSHSFVFFDHSIGLFHGHVNKGTLHPGRRSFYLHCCFTTLCTNTANLSVRSRYAYHQQRDSRFWHEGIIMSCAEVLLRHHEKGVYEPCREPTKTDYYWLLYYVGRVFDLDARFRQLHARSRTSCSTLPPTLQLLEKITR